MAIERWQQSVKQVRINSVRNILFLGTCFGLAFAAVPMKSSADDQAPSPPTRFGIFKSLDHRSFYNQGDFPEPFLVDDSGLEVNEARLDWLHGEAPGTRSDSIKAEVEKGFGLLTVELEIPYERQSSESGLTRGFDNIDLGARCPLYQFVSPAGFFDNTVGAAMEVGIPTESPVSKNAELVPKIFDDLKLGDHFTLQSIFGCSTLFGPGADGGLRTFEYGFDAGWFISHQTLPLPGIVTFIPLFEVSGETGLNHDNAGRSSILGNACFRLNLRSIGTVQPRLGFGFVFPLTGDARAEIHRGFFTSLVFEY